MENQKKLLEFLFGLIDIQIKKYIALRSIGVGPDADFNAELVFNEVNDLIQLARQLIVDIFSNQDNKKAHTIFEQIRFYVEQEAFRANASWLIDPNIIHEKLKNRSSMQLVQLKTIARSSNFNSSEPAKPIKLTQWQCLYNSMSIAAKILNLALFYRNFPEERAVELDEQTHLIFKKHAKTRYVKFCAEITRAHAQCVDLLGFTTLNRCTYSIDFKALDEQGKSHVLHKESLSQLIEQYKNVEPDFNLANQLTSFYASGNDAFFDGTLPVALNATRQEAPQSKL